MKGRAERERSEHGRAEASAPRDGASLRRLIAPRSVTVIGASEDRAKHTHRPVQALDRYAFPGDIYLINPRRTAIGGRQSLGTVQDLPHGVDVAFISRPAAEVPRLLTECDEAGIGFAVVYSSGFAEAGLSLQDSLHEMRSLRIIGPNSLGVISPASQLALTISSAALAPTPLIRSGRTALVSQSGGLMSMTLELMADREIGTAWAVSTGNETDLTAADFLRFAADDPAVDSVLLVIEGSKPADDLTGALDLLDRHGKRVFALKLGTSEAGGRGVMTHTGRLVTGANLYRDVFAQFNVLEASDPVELADLALAWAFRGTKGQARSRPAFTVVSNSGGACALLADCASSVGLEVPQLSSQTAQSLAESVPSMVSPGNPLDLTSMGYSERILVPSLTALISDPSVDGALVGLSMTAAKSETFITSLCKVKEASQKPIVACMLTGNSGAAAVPILQAVGIPAYNSPQAAARALHGVLSPPSARSIGSLERHDKKQPAIRKLPSRPLDEWESARLLEEFGLPVVAMRQALSPADAVAAADQLGYPVAVKVRSPDILHKNEVGGVRLGLYSPDQVGQAYRQVTESAASRVPGAAVLGVLVQEQVPPGVEVIVGARHDPDLGPAVIVGIGGSLVEAIGQFAAAACPLRRGDAAWLIERSGITRLLESHSLSAEQPRLIAVVENLSDLISAYDSEISEIDINPLIVTAGRVTAVDAVMVPSTSTAKAGNAATRPMLWPPGLPG
jgi:acetate---CoA ligase (ADP-forming)